MKRFLLLLALAVPLLAQPRPQMIWLSVPDVSKACPGTQYLAWSAGLNLDAYYCPAPGGTWTAFSTGGTVAIGSPVGSGTPLYNPLGMAVDSMVTSATGATNCGTTAVATERLTALSKDNAPTVGNNVRGNVRHDYVFGLQDWFQGFESMLPRKRSLQRR